MLFAVKSYVVSLKYRAWNCWLYIPVVAYYLFLFERFFASKSHNKTKNFQRCYIVPIAYTLHKELIFMIVKYGVDMLNAGRWSLPIYI